ncbi:MAG: CTP-dependent riboflavin kinase [Natronomonas sp.]
MSQATERVGNDERATLKLLALSGGLAGHTSVTCSELADRLDASSQTASRRLRRLESAGYIEREIGGDGQHIRITDEGERVLQREYADYQRLFDDEPDVELSGVVTSGMGEGRHYITLSGYMEQFRDRLGYEPFPGTLNVTLDQESVVTRARMESVDPIEIDGWEDEDRTYGPAFCWPATLRTGEGMVETAHVIAPERTHHGEEQLEVIAPIELRERLDLADGDQIQIHVTEQ